ncbi:MAG: class I SAM-dependent methyltransferase, partial [Myxococcales bacterium]|nr:class I SAM-dependent methyltransferase [Myxococcales bacterium]
GGHVLELAAGTGTWTGLLAELFERVTALDAAAETLAINRANVAAENVDYVHGDLYAYEPAAPFDFIFFGFWISHVPAERFERFWQLLEGWLKPGGRLFFIDGYYVANAESRRDEVLLHAEETQGRDLSDGRVYEIVKRYYNPPKLQAQLGRLGWDVHVTHTPSFFLYGHGSRA